METRIFHASPSTARKVVALIDTGATHNMIRRGAVVGQVKLLYQPAQLQTATVHSQARIEGTQELRCTLGKVHFQFKFLVVDRLVETVVLGYEFMQQHQVCIDTRRQCMYFGTDDRSTVFFKTGSSNTTGDNRLQSLRKGLTSITAPASPLAERAEKNFPEELRPKIHRLFDEFKSLFDMEDTSTTTTTTKHHIRLKDATPFRLRPYRYSDEKKKNIQEQVEKMLVSGVIEPSTSEYASPVVIVKKKDGQPRFCVDYRRLNAATRDEAAPLPIIQEMLRDLGQAKVFTSLDLKSGYWQVPFSDESKEYMAFTTPDGGL
jgi:hypothetical protein